MAEPLPRRTFLKCIVAVAASTAFHCSSEEPGIEEGRRYFPLSVASGDPRPDSVVLWTRAVAPERAEQDTALTLQVATDEDFTQLVLELRGLLALAEHDHTLKVKVTNLSPRTSYFYRFIHGEGEGRFASPTGRTRTAPAPEDDVPVRFAVACCQDFSRRYYNSWLRLLQLEEEPDFVVFLGDYVYEATVQPPVDEGERRVRFSEPSSAWVLRESPERVLAAASLSNYRDLYKAFRSDPLLQRVHERYPFVVMWDDHEYSNDCWGSNATYTDGRREERADERRRNAERAFFEYLPLDSTEAPAGPIDVEATPRYPDTRIYRALDFGRHLRLLVTDYRTYRPDHLIPEDAYPATVVMDEAVLRSLGLGPAFSADTFAYVDIDAPQYAQQKVVLRQAYQALAVLAGVSPATAAAKAEAAVRGPLALAYVNAVLSQAGQPPIETASQPRGLAYVHLGKAALFDGRGSRYIVVKDTFDVYAAWRYTQTARASENALGTAQEAWLLDTVQSPHSWKVVVSSVSLTSMVWDLRDKQDIPDPSLRNRYYFDVDQWDGFPDKRRELLDVLRARGGDGLLFVAGDIHAAFASVEGGVPALTTPAISSQSVGQELDEVVRESGFPPGSPVHRYLVTELEGTLRAGNPGIAFVDTDAHGFMLLEVRADEALASYHLIPSGEVHTDYSAQPESLAGRFTRRDFRIQGGSIAVG